MFNAKLKENAIENYNEMVKCYENVANKLGENINSLYKKREQAIKIIKSVERRINKLANTPKELNITLKKVDVEIENFKAKQQEINKAEVEAKAALEAQELLLELI